MPEPSTHDPRDPDEEETRTAREEGTEESEDHPRGTLFLMLVFLIVLVALWGYVYLDMLRGGS